VVAGAGEGVPGDDGDATTGGDADVDVGAVDAFVDEGASEDAGVGLAVIVFVLNTSRVCDGGCKARTAAVRKPTTASAITATAAVPAAHFICILGSGLPGRECTQPSSRYGLILRKYAANKRVS